jgi:nitrite reductase (NADH) small subunit
MPEFQTVCRVSELPEGGSKAVQVGGKLVAVFNHNGQLYAIDDVCPHMGASLSEGSVDQGIVTCAWHGFRFRLEDGVWADNPRGKMGVGCYPVRVEGEDIQIEVPTAPQPGT